MKIRVFNALQDRKCNRVLLKSWKASEAYLSISVSRGAGTGGLGLAIEGPSEAKMSCKDNKDGSCSVEYIPFTPGEYDVNITFGGLPIPGRIFHFSQQDIW